MQKNLGCSVFWKLIYMYLQSTEIQDAKAEPSIVVAIVSEGLRQ